MVNTYFREETPGLYVEAIAAHGMTAKALLSPHELHELRIERAAELLSAVAIQGDTVLDVGCGYGSLIPKVPAGVKYIGMDPNKTLLDEASKNYPTHFFIHSGIPLANDVPPPISDYVVSLGVACHLKPGWESLAWYARKLQLMARKGIIIEVQGDSYSGSFTKFSMVEVTQAFCQRPKHDNILSSAQDSATTILFML